MINFKIANLGREIWINPLQVCRVEEDDGYPRVTMSDGSCFYVQEGHLNYVIAVIDSAIKNRLKGA